MAIATTGDFAWGAGAYTAGGIETQDSTILTQGAGSHGLVGFGSPNASAQGVIFSRGDTIYTGVKLNAAGAPVLADGVTLATDPSQYVASGATGPTA